MILTVDHKLVVLEEKNIEFHTGWELPAAKMPVNMTTWEAKYGKVRAGKKARQCNKRFATVHCGPIAVAYSRVVVRWPGGSLRFGLEGLELTREVVEKFGWEDLQAVKVKERDEVKLIRREPDSISKTSVNLTLANDWHLTVGLSSETFTIWKQTNRSKTFRPWLQLISFPLGQEVSGLLNTSGLLPGLSRLHPQCLHSLDCLVFSWCPRANPTLPNPSPMQACCNSLLGHAILSLPQYPAELTSNYISFTRQRVCTSSLPFARDPPCKQWQLRADQAVLSFYVSSYSYRYTLHWSVVRSLGGSEF